MILNLLRKLEPFGGLVIMGLLGILLLGIFNVIEVIESACFWGSFKSDQRLISEMKSSNPKVKLNAISELISRGSAVVKQPEVIDWLVGSTANLLDEQADWTNPTQAEKFYNTLKRIEPKLVISSLKRHLLKPEIRLRTLFLGIKLALPGSEEKFIAVLNKHGDKSMAEDFLNSGSKRLYEGGREWAERNGYIILTFSTPSSTFWRGLR